MKNNAFWDLIKNLPARERAAAIAHTVYVLTAHRVGWELRVPESWHELSEDAREYNLASIDTWVAEPDLFVTFHEAIQSLRDFSGKGESSQQ